MRRLTAGGPAAGAGRAAGQGLGAHLAGRPDPARRPTPPCKTNGPRRSGSGGPPAAPHASETGANDGAWLDGDAAEAIACDAAMAPIVTGDVNVDALEDLVRLCVELDRRRRAATARTPGTTAAWAALEQAVIGKAVDLLSGPGGLAIVPAAPASSARGSAGRACRWTSGTPRRSRRGSATRCCCGTGTASGPAAAPSPPAACEVHHTKHKANGGKTSVKDCVLLCPFHHQVVIHRWGWTLVVNPDGTTTAWNKDKTKVLHSHGPPAQGRVAAPSSCPTLAHGQEPSGLP